MSIKSSNYQSKINKSYPIQSQKYLQHPQETTGLPKKARENKSKETNQPLERGLNLSHTTIHWILIMTKYRLHRFQSKNSQQVSLISNPKRPQLFLG